MPRPKQERSCRTCRSCAPSDELDKVSGKIAQSETTGYCLRYPPTMVGPNQSTFPPVKLDGYPCDEWKRRQ